MSDLPDAAIEAAANVIHPGGIPKANSRSIARAALEAAMPAIREQIAREIIWGETQSPTDQREVRPLLDIAARIVRGS